VGLGRRDGRFDRGGDLDRRERGEDLSDDREISPATAEEPIPNPGLPEHEYRLADVDPQLEKATERAISAMFGIAALLMVAFCVAYFTIDKGQTLFGFDALNVALGGTLGLGLLLIGLGAIQWAKKLMGDQEIIEHRHPVASSESDRDEVLAGLAAGAEESGIGRRHMIRNSLIGALAALGLPTIVLLRDLGPLPGTSPETTVWRRGMRVVNDVTGVPIKPSEMQIGQLVNAEPDVFFPRVGRNGKEIPSQYEGAKLQDAKAKAAVILVRMAPDDVHPYPQRRDWGIDGILCFSKICTHLGCPISLWEQHTHNLLCPCHQSTFDLADNGVVVFGPAARSLPQLPIGLDDQGYIIATHGFYEPVGPSFWERG
jgi:ubiquinol-cytochrome c reductase iron-sulfur subunit